MNIFDDTEKYLHQRKELSGDLFFSENSAPEKIEKDNIVINKSQKKESENSASNLFFDDSKWQSAQSLEEMNKIISKCRKCPLGQTRTKFVFGDGNPKADIMVIGEAPGRDEDMQGKPFVGRAGQLLTKILESINLSRDEVFIGNIIKCRPPNNRRPTTEEVNHCEPYLQKQIEMINPQFIIALGLTAVDTLLKKKHKMGDIRGSMMDYHGKKMLVTYHPAALLRNPKWKKPVWEDMKYLKGLYEEYLKNKGD